MKAPQKLTCYFIWAILVSLPARAALVPAGPEVLLAADPDSPLHTPVVAADRRGRSLICWQDDVGRVLCGLLDRQLQPRHPPLHVNPEHPIIDFPPVNANFGARFAVAWTSYGDAVHGRGVDNQGRLSRSERQLSQGDGPYRVDPSFAGGPDSSFFGVWSGQLDAFGETGIFARGFGAPLHPFGREFLLQPVPFPSVDPIVVWGKDLRILLVWAAGGSASGIFARPFLAAGVPIGPVVRLDRSAMPETAAPSAASSGGRFLVAWQDTAPTGESSIRAHLVSATGRLLGSERPVAQTQTEIQRLPKVAADPEEGFLVVWEGFTPADPNDYGVLARCFDRKGRPRSGDLLVNSTVEGIQHRPSVAALGGAEFAVAWEDLQFDTNQTTIRGRKVECRP